MPNRAQKSPQTENDLREIWRYISEQSPTSADAMLERIERRFKMLADHPRGGRARPELGEGVRSFPADTYMIFYLVLPDGINVVRVMHAQRDILTRDIPKETGR